MANPTGRLTTFIAPFSRYQFNRLPFGITAVSEIYQKQMSAILENKEGLICIMDDIMVSGKDQHICDRRLKATLRKIQADGILLNSKYEISRTSLEFLGHILSIDNLKLNPDKVVRVYNFTIPTNIIENQRFMGTVNQSGKFIPN